MYLDETQHNVLDRVRLRYQRRATFASHAILFGFAALCSAVFVIKPDIWRNFMTLPNIGDIFLIMVVWTAIFATHVARFFFQEAGDRAIEHELSRFGKAKRRLSSDSAIYEDDIDWEDENQQRRTR